MSRLVLVLLVLGLLSTGWAACAPMRAAVKSALLVAEVLPQVPFKPLSAIGAGVQVEQVDYGGNDPALHGRLYLPAGEGPFGAVILYLGIASPVDDPVVAPHAKTLINGLVKQDIIVLLHESDRMIAGVIHPAEIEGLVQAYQFLTRQPQVDPKRVGLFGFSVGGGLAVRAAEDPRIADQVAFVLTFGGYYDATEVVSALTTRSLPADDGLQPWEPSDLATELFTHALLAILPDAGERQQVQAALKSGATSVPGLSERGQALLTVLQNRERARTPELVQAYPELARWLAEISPSENIERLRARLHVMHDRSDPFIPYTQSRQLALAAQRHTEVVYSEFSLFQHVVPTGAVWGVDLARDVAKLYTHAVRVLAEVA